MPKFAKCPQSPNRDLRPDAAKLPTEGLSSEVRRVLVALGLMLLCMAPMVLSGQTDARKAKLEKQKIRLQDEIELANKILEETRQIRKSSVSNVQTVEQKLKLRQNLIATLDRETEVITNEMEGLEKQIDTLESQVKRLKEEYAEMIRQARKSSNNYSRLMFILSSRDFNQALRRLEYLKQISEFRRRQVEEIKRKESDLNDKLVQLNQQKVKKEAVRAQMEQERQKLQSEKLEQEQSIAELSEKEAEITKELKEKQAQAKQLENEIQRIIAAEIRRAKEKAIRRNIEDEAQRVGLIAGKDFTNRTNNKALKDLIEKKKAELRAANKPVAKAPDKPASSFNLTPEASQLAANFAANKSRLPWPVERGLVVSGFGPQRHPIAKSVIINNNGIDIATEKGSKARVAFDGEVTSVIRIPGSNLAIVVQHGNYFTIYNNLTEVYVKSGDKVSARQEIGLVHTDAAEGKTILHFELWKESQMLDPEPWLAGK